MENIGHYDVVIVGAGPAGSSVANVVSSMGFSVLLLERKSKVGVPVLCGEFLPTIPELENMFPNSKRVKRVCQIPKQVKLNHCRSIVLVSPSGKEFEFPMNANVIDRAAFDQYLANCAVDSGTELLMGSTFKKTLSSTRIEFSGPRGRKEVECDVLVGADGPLSSVARFDPILSQQNREDLSKSIQYRIKGKGFDPNRVYMFFGTVAPGGYAWIIPRSHTEANVGLGFRPSFSSQSVPLKKYIDIFLRSYVLKSYGIRDIQIKNRISALIPVSGPVQNSASAHSLLVGDAASHVMPTNGGGIPTALIGGEIAGEVINSHLQNNMPLSNYERIWRREFGNELITGATLLSIASIPMLSDGVTEWAMKFFGRNALEEIIRCRVPYPFQKMSGGLNRLMSLIAF